MRVLFFFLVSFLTFVHIGCQGLGLSKHEEDVEEDARDNEIVRVPNVHAPGGSYDVHVTPRWKAYIDARSGSQEQQPQQEQRQQQQQQQEGHRRLPGEGSFKYNTIEDISKNIEVYPPEKEPRAFSEHNRLLGMITSYDFGHIDPVMLHVIPEYVSMCEGGWDVTMVFFTSVHWTVRTRRNFRESSFCYRTNKPVNMLWAQFPRNQTAVADKHRYYMRNNVDNYDLFLYHEDDIPLKFSTVQAVVAETSLLKKRLPWTGTYIYHIGLQRYRLISRHENDAKDWDEGDIQEQTMLEETPLFDTECFRAEDRNLPLEQQLPMIDGGEWDTTHFNSDESIDWQSYQWPTEYDLVLGEDEPLKQEQGEGKHHHNRHQQMKQRQRHNNMRRRLAKGQWDNKQLYPYVVVRGNTHQGSYIMTQEQVKVADIKCNFLQHRSSSREYMSSFSLYDRNEFSCGFQKILPALNFPSFLVHHFYEQRHINWWPASVAHDKFRRGRSYLKPANLSNHACWEPIFDQMQQIMKVEQQYKKETEEDTTKTKLPWSAYPERVYAPLEREYGGIGPPFLQQGMHVDE